MERLCHVLWLKWQFADLPTFCFTSMSNHFIEGTQITQSNVASHISLEAVPVCFAEGDGPNFNCCQSSTLLFFISLLKWEWSWRKTSSWQESQMLEACSPCATRCITSPTEPHQQPFPNNTHWNCKKHCLADRSCSKKPAGEGCPPPWGAKHHQALQETHSNSYTSLIWAVLPYPTRNCPQDPPMLPSFRPAWLTQVVVTHHGIGGTKTGTLLSEMVPEFQ